MPVKKQCLGAEQDHKWLWVTLGQGLQPAVVGKKCGLACLHGRAAWPSWAACKSWMMLSLLAKFYLKLLNENLHLSQFASGQGTQSFIYR